jgi:hypothetical protein
VLYLVIGGSGSSLEGKAVDKERENSMECSDIIEITRTKKSNNLRIPEYKGEKKAIIEEAVICLKIEKQSPSSTISKIPPEVSKIFCWVKINEGKGEKIRYIWYLDGKVTTSGWQVITSDSFRSWCPFSYNIKNATTGHVDIVSSSGEVLKKVKFQILAKKNVSGKAKRS